jgi:hypothetical protein
MIEHLPRHCMASLAHPEMLTFPSIIETLNRQERKLPLDSFHLATMQSM